MPIGYLISVALIAWYTLCAVRPPRPRQSSPFNVVFWFGFLVNELPFVAMVWLVAATVIAAAQGDLLTPVGLVGLGIALVTMAGLVVIVRRALAARPVLERALADAGFGTAAIGRHLRWARIVLWPFPTRGRDIERISDIDYGDAGRGNRLDLYRPRRRRPDGPTLVYLHGGAFRIGNKSREARPLLHRLARHGCVCISANYRLAREATFPAPLIDVKRVIAWVRENGPAYGADPNRVIVAASSAGAHLASTAALTPNEPTLQPGFERVDTSIDAVVGFYGYYGAIDTTGPPSSPHDYAPADRPPFLIAHGENDTLVIVEDARLFVDHLRATSPRPVAYAELPGAQHDFDLVYSIRFEAVVDAVEVFLGIGR
jgi:acetyl esterase/lipase